jgi:hypothetical protein
VINLDLNPALCSFFATTNGCSRRCYRGWSVAQQYTAMPNSPPESLGGILSCESPNP